MAFDDVVLTIYREDGTIAGTIDLGARAAGPQTYSWNGTPGGSTPLPDGRYLIQVSATAGTATYHAPSVAPFGAGQLDRLGLTGAFSKDKARSFVIAGVVPHVPSNAIAVTGNLTVTEATGGGWLRLGPSVTSTSSTINFTAGDNRANGITLGLAADGSLSGLYHTSSAKGTVQVIFDLTGYFLRDANGATFVPIAPTRIVDSRARQGLSAPLAAGKIATFSVTGLAGVPSNAIAVSGNPGSWGISGGVLAIAGGVTYLALTLPSLRRAPPPATA